jgi:hypothetical protein
MANLLEDLRLARRRRRDQRRDPILAPLVSPNIPSSWLRTHGAAQTVYRRDIRCGRQSIITLGWDGARQAPTWELTTHWHDARGRETSDHDTISSAFRAADDASSPARRP